MSINGKTYESGGGGWKVSPKHIPRLYEIGRIVPLGKRLYFKRYSSDFEYISHNNLWTKLAGGSGKIYVVQTNAKIIQRCILMTTDPGDLVFDPTCGSGTTAYVAEQWGRRWITCDTSRVALALVRQRLMTASFDYYRLARPSEGVDSGFEYKTTPHITLKSIANDQPPATETLYDQPLRDSKRARVSGPFTVEAVPAPVVQSLDEIATQPQPQSAAADASLARSGESVRQQEWRDELLQAGIRAKSGQRISFARVEHLGGTRWLHADAETKPDSAGADSVRESAPAYAPQRAVVSFGPEHAPLEQRQVAHAIEEAQTLAPQPKLIIFAAFTFDPQAAKDIDETKWAGITLLKVEMNSDLQTGDLKKRHSSNESFWLVGQPGCSIEPN